MLYERTLGQWLEHWAETTPDREYIVYSDRNLRFTWSQFNRRVDDMAKGLIAIGVERGTHVGIWAANVPDWLTLLYACAKIGAVYVTVNTNYKQSELEYLCQNSDMHTLCIVNGEKDSDFVQMTYAMLPELRTCQRGHLRSERFPYMRNVIYVGQEKYRGMYNTAEILLLGDNVDDSRLDEMKAKVTCHDVVNMQYTSGTTGFPKGVMLTHYNIANNGFLTGEHMKFTQDDKLCVCVPLFHCFGVVLATMNCLTHGCTEVMVERFDPLVVLASIHKERCTALYGVPTMFIAELNHPMFDMFDMSSLRTGIMAGSLCPVELMKQVWDCSWVVVGSSDVGTGMLPLWFSDAISRMMNIKEMGGLWTMKNLSYIDGAYPDREAFLMSVIDAGFPFLINCGPSSRFYGMHYITVTGYEQWTVRVPRERELDADRALLLRHGLAGARFARRRLGAPARWRCLHPGQDRHFRGRHAFRHRLSRGGNARLRIGRDFCRRIRDRDQAPSRPELRGRMHRPLAAPRELRKRLDRIPFPCASCSRRARCFFLAFVGQGKYRW